MSSKIYSHNEIHTLGSRLRTFRREKKHNIADFAKLIGISQGSLSNLENDKAKPAADTLANIVSHTNMNIAWLLTGQGEPFVSSSTETTPPKDVPQYIIDLLRKTERVLKSDSMYCNLLAGAIMAYDKSLTDEEEKLTEKRRLNAMESQFKECVAQLNDLLETKKYSNTGD